MTHTTKFRVLSLCLTALPLLALLGSNPVFAQNSGGSSNNGSAGQIVPNPYIQQAPGTNGQGQQPGGFPQVTDPNTIPSLIPNSIFYVDIKEYVLHPDELINLRLYGVLDYIATVRLSKDGSVELPLIGNVVLGGLTIEQADRYVEKLLREKGMYRNPEITITLAEAARGINVLFSGEMHGIFALRNDHSIQAALSLAGGLPPDSNHTIQVIRDGAPEPILVDLGTTGLEMARVKFELQPKDEIFVQRAGFVYVLGQFKSTGAVPLQPGRMTLMQIAALCGGPQYTAKYADMTIVRTVGTQRSEVKVDISKVLHGKAPDPIMQSGDIIYLPPSALKEILASSGVGSILALVNIILLFERPY